MLRSMKNPHPESNKNFVECFVGNPKLGEYFSGYSSSLARCAILTILMGRLGYLRLFVLLMNRDIAL